MNTHISRKRKLLYGATATVLLLLFLESIARVVEFIKPPYEIKLASETLSEQGHSPKQEPSFRIFVYGGSTVEGQPIKEFGFVSQLEFWLRELHPEKPLEVYNFGRSALPSAHVRRMVEESITHDPDLLIVLSGHNEFLSRRMGSLPDTMLTSFALSRVLVRVFKKLKAALFPLDKNIVMPIYQGFDRDSSLFKRKVQIYLDNLSSIVETARKRNKPLLLLTAPSNVSDWPPVHKRIGANDYEEEYESWIAEVDRFLADGVTDRAIENIHELLHTYRNDPLLLYLLARTHAVAGDYDRARTLYTRAKDLDPIPWRALTDFNQAIRKLAELDGVFLVDVENSFQQQAMHGLVGFSLVSDNCHPTPLGNAIIARDLLTLMGQKRLFVERDFGHRSIDGSLEHYLSETTMPDTRRSLEMRYLLNNAKYSMKTPFYNFNAARMYLDKALGMDSSNWEIWVNLATLAFFENRIEEGREQLGMAIQLRGAPIDRNDRRNAPYLREALEQSGVRLEEFR